MSERERFDVAMTKLGYDDEFIKQDGDCFEIWQAAILAERERCAKIAEEHHEKLHVLTCNGNYSNCGLGIAAAIRRGEGAD